MRQGESNFKLIFVIVLLAIFTRIAGPSFGHNFAPMNAISLFCGAYFTSALLAIAVPLLSIVVGDYAVNYLYAGELTPLYPGWYWQYVCYVLLACVGMALRNRIKPLPVVATSLGSSVLFFLVSNFGVWVSGGLYPHTWEGLVTCFALAIPFFKGTLFGDLFFVVIMFGTYELIRRGVNSPSHRPIAA